MEVYVVCDNIPVDKAETELSVKDGSKKTMMS